VSIHRVFAEPLDDDERRRAEGALAVLDMFTRWDPVTRTFRPRGDYHADPGAVLRALGRIVEGEWRDPWEVSPSTAPGDEEHPAVTGLRRSLES
jgi:hypothetical protein